MWSRFGFQCQVLLEFPVEGDINVRVVANMWLPSEQPTCEEYWHKLCGCIDMESYLLIKLILNVRVFEL